MLIFTKGYITRNKMVFSPQHSRENSKKVSLSLNLPPLSSSCWCCLSLVCQAPLSSSAVLLSRPPLLLPFLPSHLLSFNFITASFPVHLISTTFSVLPSISLAVLSFSSIFLWQWMRDGGQFVDAGVSKILSAHHSFENDSFRRTSVIFPLHPFQNYIRKVQLWEGERSAQSRSLNITSLWICLYCSVYDLSWVMCLM